MLMHYKYEKCICKLSNEELLLPLNGRCRKPGPRFCVVPESFVIGCCVTLTLLLTSGGLFPGKSL